MSVQGYERIRFLVFWNMAPWRFHHWSPPCATPAEPLAAMVLPHATLAAPATTYFDDSAPGIMRLGNTGRHPYPLAQMLARDKVLFYQHDLAPETFTFDKATQAWNMAMGYMLSCDLVQSTYGGGVESPWLDVEAVFQKYVLSRYAGERVTAYTSLGPAVTQTSFASFAAITNWDTSSPYATAGYVLPPQGVMTRKNDGTLVAGVFTSYNGVALSAGDHYLVEERGLDQIIVRQPMGGDTSLTMRLLPGWTAATRVEAWALVALIATADRVAGVRRAIELLGINPVRGRAILIKPNFNSADKAPGSTHPDVLRTPLAALVDLGARSTMLADRSGMGNTR